jgi:hypothetical protein
MFGTDWFMLSQEPWWPDFPGLLADRVDGLIPPEDLFYRNAIACYGLGQGGAQRARVLDRLAKSTAGEPAWLSAAA